MCVRVCVFINEFNQQLEHSHVLVLYCDTHCTVRYPSTAP